MVSFLGRRFCTGVLYFMYYDIFVMGGFIYRIC